MRACAWSRTPGTRLAASLDEPRNLGRTKCSAALSIAQTALDGQGVPMHPQMRDVHTKDSAVTEMEI